MFGEVAHFTQKHHHSANNSEYFCICGMKICLSVSDLVLYVLNGLLGFERLKTQLREIKFYIPVWTPILFQCHKNCVLGITYR